MYLSVDEHGELVEWSDVADTPYDPHWRTNTVTVFDPRQPPAYRGRTWPMATRDGVIQSPVPPMRDDPQGPCTDAFLDFQRYAGERALREHPEDFCAIHHTALSYTNKCGRCIAASQAEQQMVDAKAGKARLATYADA